MIKRDFALETNEMRPRSFITQKFFEDLLLLLPCLLLPQLLSTCSLRMKINNGRKGFTQDHRARERAFAYPDLRPPSSCRKRAVGYNSKNYDLWPAPLLVVLGLARLSLGKKTFLFFGPGRDGGTCTDRWGEGYQQASFILFP